MTLNSKLGLISKGLIGAEWLFFRRGLGATNHFESCGFIRSRPGVEYPDIQYHFLPGAIRYDGKAAAPGHGFQVHVGPMRSRSRGSVTLRSGEPRDPPRIRFNYMSHPSDWEDFRRCIRLTRELFRQPAMQRYRRQRNSARRSSHRRRGHRHLRPGALRERLSPLRHLPHGPRRRPDGRGRPAMPGDRHRRLRVADSSIFPQVTNGNLNAPSIMTGEKAADLLLGRDPLPASNLRALDQPGLAHQPALASAAARGSTRNWRPPRRPC